MFFSIRERKEKQYKWGNLLALYMLCTDLGNQTSAESSKSRLER